MTLEGMLVGSEIEGKFSDRTLIYRDGSIETVYSSLHHKPKDEVIIPGTWLMENILHTIEKSLAGLVTLGANGPYVIGVTLQTLKGMPIAFYHNTFRGYPKFDRDLVELPALMLPEYDSSMSIPVIIRPLLDSLWNSVGLPECGYFKGDVWQLPH